MKKFILMMLVMVGGVLSASADDVTIYFQPNSNWKSDGAWFAIYLEDNSSNHDWEQFTAVTGHDGYYKVTVSTTWKKFVLCRMSSSATLADQKKNSIWEGKVWNQCPTGDNRIDILSRDALYGIKYDGNHNEYNNSLVPWEYYFVSNKDNDSWQVDGKMSGSGPYTYTFDGDDYAGKCFGIAKGDALWAGGTIQNWGGVIRPTSADNSSVQVLFNSDFANYSVSPAYSTSGNGSVWYMPSTVPDYEKVSITYTEGTSVAIRPNFTRSIKSHGYSTFASDYAVAIPDGVTATYTTGVSGHVLTEVAFTKGIPANTGALLYKEGGGTVTFTPAATTDTPTGNKFVRGTGTTVAQTDGAGNTNYILTTDRDTKPVGFYMINGTSGNTVGTDKAYLSVSSINAREYFIFGEGNDVSSINASKNLEKNSGVYYNLNGQRITQPTKGFYIVNGKKVIVK